MIDGFDDAGDDEGDNKDDDNKHYNESANDKMVKLKIVIENDDDTLEDRESMKINNGYGDDVDIGGSWRMLLRWPVIMTAMTIPAVIAIPIPLFMDIVVVLPVCHSLYLKCSFCCLYSLDAF